MAMATVAQAFLFNADAECVSGYYGGDFEPPFLRALSAVDPRGITRSTALLGDIIPSTLCERVTAVSRKPRGSSHTAGHNMDLYRTIIWDLADAFAGQWHTLDLEDFPIVLGRRNVYCITMASLPIEFRDGIDARLRITNGYLGSVEIDLGNPIQKKLRGERRVAYGELDGLKPPIPEPTNFSDRGQISADRYNGKRRYTVHDRVLLALSRLQPQSGEPVAFSFEASPVAKVDVLEAELPEAKFVRYLLNPDHAHGRGKAKFFNDELGIGADDWRYL